MPSAMKREAVSAARVVGEQLTEVEVADLSVVLGQFGPGGTGA